MARPEHSQSLEMAYENLANAIIIQAVEDYRVVLRSVEKCKRKLKNRNLNPTDIEYFQNELYKERLKGRPLKKFFSSDYFCLLSETDGPALCKAIEREAEENNI